MLQPVVHALVGADEDVAGAIADLSSDQVWRRVGGSASIGFHVMHLAGSTDRLLTYARGESLSDHQRAALTRERSADEERPPVGDLLDDWRQVLSVALLQLRSTEDATLSEPRLVGRAGLPSTVLGLLFHAAEHAARHAGQVVTTARIVLSSPTPEKPQ
jgi:uncharacterized damage-inducible protein DinB